MNRTNSIWYLNPKGMSSRTEPGLGVRRAEV